MLNKQYYVEKAKVDRLVARKNTKADFYNGIYDRYEYPVLTREFAPVHWRYDLDEETNPYFMERLGINAVMNSGGHSDKPRRYGVPPVQNTSHRRPLSCMGYNCQTLRCLHGIPTHYLCNAPSHSSFPHR